MYMYKTDYCGYFAYSTYTNTEEDVRSFCVKTYAGTCTCTRSLKNCDVALKNVALKNCDVALLYKSITFHGLQS